MPHVTVSPDDSAGLLARSRERFAFHLDVAQTLEQILRPATQAQTPATVALDYSSALRLIDDSFKLEASILLQRSPLERERLLVRGSTSLKTSPFADGVTERFESEFLDTLQVDSPWRPLKRNAYARDSLWELIWQTMELGPYARGWALLARPLGFAPDDPVQREGVLILIARGTPFPAWNEDDERHLQLLSAQLSLAIETGNSLSRAHDHVREISDRMASAGQATQIHNMFSPLQRLELHAELCKRAMRSNDLPRQRKYLDAIQADAWDASRFAKNVLELTGGGAAVQARAPNLSRAVESHSLLDALDEKYRSHVGAAGKQLVIRHATSVAYRVLISEAHFDEVAGNLIHNAIKYAARGTKIKIEFRVKGKHGLLDVTSYGIPIPRDEFERIFELGYRTPDAQRIEMNAVGFGLYRARQLARLAGGDLYVTRSEPDAQFAPRSLYRSNFRLRVLVQK